MKKKYRVKKAGEFQTIIEHRKFVSCPSFVLYVKARKEEHSRIGISVGKKLGNAVVRNKTKRQVRMMFQEIYDFDENFDGILIVRKKFLEQSYADNKKDLESIIKKVKIKKYA